MNIAFVWHFHQPIYKDPESGEYLLPWVGFHAVKNYFQMARLAEEEGFPATYNFVPCLLEQVLEYARGEAQDPFLAALEKDPDKLTFNDRRLLATFVPDEPSLRLLQERAMRSLFSPLLTRPLDREGWLGLRREILAGLIDDFKRLRDRGLAELTTSPYHHPLLPLIFDIRSAGEESRGAAEFRYPEDGRAELESGRSFFARVFGRLPTGLWPSEGGVSDEVARAAAETGFRFALTDENILWKSRPQALRPNDLFRPYCAGGLTVLFRDRELSDLISFEYQKRPADEAVEDLLARLESRRDAAGEDGLVLIVLDGENPWEFYPSNGVPFLRSLYARLLDRRDLTLTSLEGYLARHPAQEELTLVPGTWLGDFSKWIGHPAKNAAWDLLGRARRECGPSPALAVAEGSDWFWWAGEEGKDEFDYLFRAYVRRAWREAGREDPS